MMQTVSPKTITLSAKLQRINLSYASGSHVLGGGISDCKQFYAEFLRIIRIRSGNC